MTRMPGCLRRLLVGVVLCAVLYAGLFVLSLVPFPSPRAYAGPEVSARDQGSSLWESRWVSYTVNLPLQAMERFYENQMPAYCTAPSSWVETRSSHHLACRTSSCSVRRVQAWQEFVVELCYLSSNQTQVSQYDYWDF
jgi:hypothetical protein